MKRKKGAKNPTGKLFSRWSNLSGLMKSKLEPTTTTASTNNLLISEEISFSEGNDFVGKSFILLLIVF